MLKVAVVGVGSLGRHHARILASIAEVKLVGVADIDRDRGRAVAAEYQTSFFPDYRELVKEVDCACVATPTVTHHEVGAAFLDAGRPVLMEKPIAATPAEGEDLVARAHRAGALLQVGHIERFNPAMLAVKPLIAKPRFFEVHRLGMFTGRSLDVDVVSDLMIHDLDLVLWLTGSPVTEIRAAGAPVLTDKIDLANVRLEFANGAVANLTASRVSQQKMRKFRFFQSGRYVSVDLGNQRVCVCEVRQAANPQGREIATREVAVSSGEPLRNEIEDFVRCVQKGERPACTGEDGLAALKVVGRILDVIKIPY
jgi:predicted dehydrogenase